MEKKKYIVVDEDVHKSVRFEAVKQSTTMQEVVNKILRKELGLEDGSVPNFLKSEQNI